MFGWRCGWVAGPAELIQALLVVHEHAVGSATSVAQAGALAALQLDASAIQPTLDQYRRARDVMVEGLKRIPGIRVHTPEGGSSVSGRSCSAGGTRCPATTRCPRAAA